VIFVHIGDARLQQSFRRTGIRLPPARTGRPRGVFVMPVLKDHFVSHQWLRELKRRGMRTLVGVYVRVPDREPVLVGHYRIAHTAMSAARAARLIMDAPDPRGYEVIIPRKVDAKEIHAVRGVPQVVGWRYYPEAKGRKPCGCPACARGDIKAKRLREAYEAAFRGTQ
jgi:hypothetical protein